MRTLAALAGTCVLVAVLAPMATAQGNWTAVFDGKTLNGFDPIGDANWHVADGAIQADTGMGGFLMSKQAYGDFEIKAEFWADAANSGIFIRRTDPKTINAENSYEVNIFDKRPDPSYGTGAIVDFARIHKMQKAAGKWNTLDITAKGNKLTVVMNGVKTVDVEDNQHAAGYIALQHGAGTIKFRKVQIKKLWFAAQK